MDTDKEFVDVSEGITVLEGHIDIDGLPERLGDPDNTGLKDPIGEIE